jgi:decaprenylphospho-beta-D-erythro-pentofuranosid-2-ulose 2-reductase
MSTTPATSVLLLGGNSEIGVAIVRRLAAQQIVRPYLLGRDRERLTASLEQLRSAGCIDGELDLLDAGEHLSHAPVLKRAFERAGGFDVVVLAIGVLGAQAGLDADPAEVEEVMRVNFVGCGSLLIESLGHLRRQGEGTIVVLSSVAAERARSGNAIYSAAKAGLDALAQGMADRCAGTGVRVLVVRPGFVRTRMTAGLPAAPLACTPEEVADATVKALSGRQHTIWVPRKLRLIFAILRHLPRAVYRRLPL